MTKLIGVLLLLFVIWFMYKLMRPYPPERPTMSIRERQELRRQTNKNHINLGLPIHLRINTEVPDG